MLEGLITFSLLFLVTYSLLATWATFYYKGIYEKTIDSYLDLIKKLESDYNKQYLETVERIKKAVKDVKVVSQPKELEIEFIPDFNVKPDPEEIN